MISWLSNAPGPSRTTLWFFWLSLGAFCLFVVTAVAYVRAEKAIDRANESRFNSYLLADELRQSSDDLTRMVRTYVATSNPRCKEHYQEILDIREGRKPRPVDEANVYWDLVMDDDVRPRHFGPAVALLDLMQAAGFTPAEFAALAEAKAASDALAHTEYAAMALVESHDPTPDSDRVRAIQMLQNSDYRQAKASIMGPIAKFNAMSARRALGKVQAARVEANRIRWFVMLLGAALALSLWRLFRAINDERREKAANYALFRAVFDNAAVGLAQVSTTGQFQIVNQEFCQIVGYAPSQLLAIEATILQLTLPDDRTVFLNNLERLLRGETDEFTLTERCVHRSGSVVWVNVFVYLLHNAAMEPASLIVAAVDVTDAKAAEAELANHREHLEQLVEERTLELAAGNDHLKREIAARQRAVEALQKSEGRFRFIAENSADVIWTLDVVAGRFTYVSPSVQALRGYTIAEAMAQPVEAMLTPESMKRVRELFSASIARFNAGDRAETTQTFEVDQPHKDGHIVHTEVVTTLLADDSGNLSTIVGVTRDITERKKSERVIRQLAFHDGLTKLPNRRLLQDRLEQAILRARRDGSRLAVLFVDLDRFKPINDAFGHQVGDWLLCNAAARMQSCLRDSDTAARIGGDEFVILLPDLVHPNHAMAVGERVRAAIEKPFLTATGDSLEISASIGVALYPDHAEDKDELLDLGDKAMYQAKNLGRNRVTMLAASVRPFDSGHMPIAAANSLFRLSWSPAYACGDTVIDSEHQELFAMVNRLLEVAMGTDQRERSLSKGLDKLLTATRTHFHHEEERLRDCGYPRLEEHATLHRTLLTRANLLRQKVEVNDVTIGQLIDFLAVEVIARHLLEADREFFPFIGHRQSTAPATGT